MAILTQHRIRPSIKRSVRIKQVDAFTEIPLSGNPAGVVLDASGLTDKQMQAIAGEISLPETAFILPASTKNADLRIRWFTPTAEVPLCEHATIASLHALAEDGMDGMAGEGTFHVTVETQSGPLPITVEKMNGSIHVWLGLSLPVFKRASIQKLDVMRILNISLDDFDSHLPIVSDQYLFVPIRRLHTVFEMKPTMFALSQFLSNRNISGICVFTTETVDRGSSVHSRCFSPNMGLNEDPVTGSANGFLGMYLFENGVLKEGGAANRSRRAAKHATPRTSTENKVVTITAEQGDAIGRKGRVSVRLSLGGNQVTALSIGGKAVTVFDVELLIA